MPGPAWRVRQHVGDEALTLDEYRIRHAQYKTDPDLQRLHAAVPWIVTWDDHEVDNDYADDASESLGARTSSGAAPPPSRRTSSTCRCARRRAPTLGPAHGCTRVATAGTLARFHVLDGRQYRTPQACPPPGRGGATVVDETAPSSSQPGRTMLGTRQERWLAAGLAAAPERWNVIAQQTLMAQPSVVVDGPARLDRRLGRLPGSPADAAALPRTPACGTAS